MATKPTRYDRALTRIKNHRVAAGLLLAALGLTSLAALTDAMSRLRTLFAPASELELLAVQERGIRVLDVTLRNVSSEEAVITAVTSEVERITDNCFAKNIFPSAHFVVPIRLEEGFVGERSVRFAVEPHRAERFTVTTAPEPACLTVRFTLRYNRGRTLAFSHSF